VSFQITILKVLAGFPKGRDSLDDLRHVVAVLISSGSDWADRTKRLASRAPGLEIFTQGLVLRDIEGWQITDAGRVLLAILESPTFQPISIGRPIEPALAPDGPEVNVPAFQI
jgi:hypothetical protein